MPVDRLITVRNAGEGFYNDFGEYEMPVPVDIRVWAGRRDKDAEDIESEGGVRDETRRDWRIRYRSDIADVPTSQLSVVDGPLTFDVLNVVEVTGRDSTTRRRWLDIQGVYTT